MMRILTQAMILLMTLAAGAALAKIPEPDQILYGNASLYGDSLSPGIEVSLVLGGQVEPVASYRMGSDPAIAPFYALRIPMDSLEPRQAGTARPGESGKIYIAGQFAADVQVGEQGTAVRLDIDPAFLEGSGPNITIQDVSVVEGNGGIKQASFDLALSTTSSKTVSVDWATSDALGTATGGGYCGAGVDFIHAAGTASFAPGSMATQVNVNLCGETLDEADETFYVELSNALNGHIKDGQARGVIVDDDVMPVLTINDVTVIEPEVGSVSALFTITLSEVWPSDIGVAYSVGGTGDAISATAGADFLAESGNLIIPAGSPNVTLAVTVYADGVDEADETLRVELSSPSGADIADNEGIGTIIDPGSTPGFEMADQQTDSLNGVVGMTGPIAAVSSPDGAWLYVAARSADAIFLFARDAGDGSLTLADHYDGQSPGFAEATLDGVEDLVISPDGRFLYAAAYNDDAIAVFQRDLSSGALSHVESVIDAISLDGVTELIVSGDGDHLYAVAEQADALVAFSRNANNGGLTWIDEEFAAADQAGLMGGSGLALSPDGLDLYVTSAHDNTLLAFTRENDPNVTGYGQLTRSLAYQDNLAGVDGIRGASAIAITRDGRHLYVTGEYENALAVFARDPATGALSWVDQVRYGDPGLAGMLDPLAVAVSHDGAFVYVAGYSDDSVTVFERERDPASADFGRLSIVENVLNGMNGVDGMRGPADLTVSPDDQDLYVTGFIDDAVVVLRRVAQPIFSSSFE